MQEGWWAGPGLFGRVMPVGPPRLGGGSSDGSPLGAPVPKTSVRLGRDGKVWFY